MKYLSLFGALLLAGCGGSPIVANLTPPDAALMAKPKPLPPLKDGNLKTLIVNNAEVRGVCVAEQGRLEGLQAYVTTLLGK